MKKINKRWIFVIIGVIVCAVVFLWSTVLYKVFSASDIKSEITGTLLGTIISAIVTVLLLQGQTEIEEGKDISLNIFSKKQEVYFDFINCLEKITKDGKINVPGTNGYNLNGEDELQELIYELGKVQMTANHSTSLKVTKQVGNVLKILNENEANKGSLYSSFAEELFKLVNILREDLYGMNSKEEAISKDDFRETLVIAGLGDELEKLDNTSKAIQKFLDLTTSILKEKYGLNCTYIVNDIYEGTNSKKTADAFSQLNSKNQFMRICFQRKDRKYVWIEFTPTGVGAGGVRLRESSGQWGNWSNARFQIGKKIALKDITFANEFNNKDENEQKSFSLDFVSSFENFDSFLNS